MVKESKGIAVAITEKFLKLQNRVQKAERELAQQREMISNCPLPILLLDRAGIAVFANDACCRLLDCNLGHLLGNGWKHFVHRADQAELEKLIQAALDEGPNPKPERMRLIRQNGSQLEACFKIHTHENGEMVVYCAPCTESLLDMHSDECPT